MEGENAMRLCLQALRTRSGGPTLGTMRTLGPAMALAVALVGGRAVGGVAALDVENDRVTGSFDAAPPTEVVEAIARAAGAELIGGPQASDPISIELDDVPLDRALERVLGSQSFTLVYGSDGGVRRIRLHGGAQAVPTGPPGAATTPPGSGGKKINYNSLHSVEVQIPTVGPLAEYMGRSTATLGELYRVATAEEQAALRIAAIDAGMAAIESDANLQAAIDDMLAASQDDELAGIVRATAGERANELVSRVLSRTRRPNVRQRAVTLLRKLREPQG